MSFQVALVHWDLLDLLDQLDPEASLEGLEQPVSLEDLVDPVLLEDLEYVELLDSLEELDPLDHRELLDSLADLVDQEDLVRRIAIAILVIYGVIPDG